MWHTKEIVRTLFYSLFGWMLFALHSISLFYYCFQRIKFTGKPFRQGLVADLWRIMTCSGIPLYSIGIGEGKPSENLVTCKADEERLLKKMESVINSMMEILQVQNNVNTDIMIGLIKGPSG